MVGYLKLGHLLKYLLSGNIIKQAISSQNNQISQLHTERCTLCFIQTGEKTYNNLFLTRLLFKPTAQENIFSKCLNLQDCGPL